MYRILIFHVSSMIWKTLKTRHGNQVANSTYTFPNKESQVLSSYGLASQLNPCSLSVWKYFIWFWWGEVCNVCKFPLHQPAKKDKPKIKCPIWCYSPGLHGKLWKIMYLKKKWHWMKYWVVEFACIQENPHKPKSLIIHHCSCFVPAQSVHVLSLLTWPCWSVPILSLFCLYSLFYLCLFALDCPWFVLACLCFVGSCNYL